MPRHDAPTLRLLAGRTRHEAEQSDDAELRQLLHEAAEDYDRLAEWMERDAAQGRSR